jgi:hypothetical protein
MAPPEIMSQLVALAAVSRQAFGVARHGYLNLSLDGNQWCVLFGSNLHDGVAGFGNTFNDERGPNESLAETTARAMGISVREFRAELWRRAGNA